MDKAQRKRYSLREVCEEEWRRYIVTVSTPVRLEHTHSHLRINCLRKLSELGPWSENKHFPRISEIFLFECVPCPSV